MNAILMAGGEGTRLKSIWPEQPKPMIPLLGKPVMERLLTLLKHSGVRRVRASLRYMPGVITGYFGDGSRYGLELSYSVESVPLGTAGGVRACADFYGERDFFVLSGDAVCDFDLRVLAEFHRRSGAAVTMALAASDTPTGYGLVVRDERGFVRGFLEKPAWSRVVTDRVNTGIYVVSPRAMAYVPPDGPFDFARDLFPKLLRAGETVAALPMDGYWCDVGTPRAYYQANLDALDGRVRLYAPDGKREAPPAEPSAPPEPETREAPADCTAEIPCASRARLMRLLTERFLFEAGADFSDGLSLPGVHFAPKPDGEAVSVRTDSPEGLERWKNIAETLRDSV